VFLHKVNPKAIAEGKDGVKILLRCAKISLAASVKTPTADLILTAADRKALGTANLDPAIQLSSAKPTPAPEDETGNISDVTDDDESDDNFTVHELAEDSTEDDEVEEEEPVTPKAKTKTPKARVKQQVKATDPTRSPARGRELPARAPPTAKPKGENKQVQHEIEESDDDAASESTATGKWSKAESDKRCKIIDANIAHASKRADDVVRDSKRLKNANAQPATTQKPKKNPVTPKPPDKNTAAPVRASTRARTPKRQQAACTALPCTTCCSLCN